MIRSVSNAATVAAWLEIQADQRPDKTAIVFGDERISYREFNEQTDSLAAALDSFGVRPGDRVATLLTNTPDFCVIFFAALRVGAALLPMNSQYQDAEIEQHLDQLRPSVIFVSSEAISRVQRLLASRQFHTRVLVGCPTATGPSYGFEELLKHHRGTAERRAADLAGPALSLFSSGSTGGSKLVTRTQAQLVAEANALASTVSLSSDDRFLCAIPLSHAHGLGNALMASVYAGAELVILERFDRRAVVHALDEHRVTVFPTVPFMARILAETPLREEPDLSDLRLVFTAGAPLDQDTFDAFTARFGVPIRQLYGSTETGVVSANTEPEPAESWSSVGAPLKGVDIGIFGANDERLGPGETGVVGISSPAMFTGYANREDLNPKVLRSGFFFPGDLGSLDQAGRLTLSGRETLFINVGGNKVAPEDVESVIAEHPDVAEVVVLGIKAERGSEQIVKAVVVQTSPCTAEELQEFCRGKVADFKVPRIIEFREEIPRSPLGKVLRKYLQ